MHEVDKAHKTLYVEEINVTALNNVTSEKFFGDDMGIQVDDVEIT